MAASNNKKTFARTLTLSAIAATVLAACDSGPATIALSDRCTVATQITNNTAAATASVSGSLSSMVTSGTAVRYELVTAPSNGSLSIGATSGGYLYTTASTSRGFSDSFSVRAIGAEGNVATATYTVIFGNRRIMPLGDSITFGVTSYNGTADFPTAPTAVGYRKALYDRLIAGGYAIDFVGDLNAGASANLDDTDHSGIPGDTTADINGRVATTLTSEPADVILLHAGTNGATDASGINDILTTIQSWSSVPTNPSADTLVARIVPSPLSATNTRINGFNTDLDIVMSTSWPSLTVVDMNSALNASTDMTSAFVDLPGVHPNASGYAKMADQWFNALTNNGKVNRCS